MSEVATKIGDYTITEEDVDAFIATLGQEQQMYASIPQFRAQVRDRLEELSLLAMYAKEIGLNEKQSYRSAMMAAERDIASQMAIGEVLDGIEATEEEMKSYFDSNPQSFGKAPNATASHILVDSEDRANEIRKEIEEGGKSFEEAARAYSTCPSKDRGGSLGNFTRGQMVPEFDEVVFSGELNRILGPVKTQFGYHLIRIDAREDAKAPEYEAVKNEVRSAVVRTKQQAAYDAKVAELRRKYM